jgi:hypothetical protein
LATLLSLAFVAATPTFTQATTMAPMSTAQLAAQSSDIVVGTVTNLRSVWVNRTLMTLVTVSVSESLKGDGAAQKTVVIPGGIDPNRAVPVAILYPGAPMMNVSDEVVLFLQGGSAVENALQIVGYAQGKFSIVRDGSDFVLAQGMTPDSRRELASFKTEIRELVTAKGGDRHE